MQNQESAHILVVDDEASICEFLTRLLGDSGYRVTATTNAVEALRWGAQEKAPDLLLTDFKMPVMDGQVLSARLREKHPDLPVLYLTGFSDELFRATNSLGEREAFLDKPASPAAVLEAVELILRGQTPPQPGKPGIMWLSSLKHGLLTLNVSGHHR